MGFLRRSEPERLERAGDIDGLFVLVENGAAKDRFDAFFAITAMELDESQQRRLADAALTALSDASSDVRGAGAFVLGELRVREVSPQLLDTLNDAEPYPRMMAATSLGWLAPAEAYEPLVRMAQSDKDELARELATRALASYPAAADVLRALGTSAASDALREQGAA